jgi:signal peptidase
MDKTFKIFYRVFLVAVIIIIVLLLITLFPIKGNYQVKIVKSGSMEPSIHTGSIVIIKPNTNYTIGDIVTFGKDTKKDIPTTHRITKSRAQQGVIMFTTKGDSNEDNDTNEIRQSDIHGKVLFSIPFLGYIIDLARKPIGFVVFIILPAIIVVYDEGVKIFKEIKKMKRKKEAVQEDNISKNI